ncbi:MAG: nucleotide sugar dehydrogenase [Candidatus Sumerlaeia bacterium]|nr:nucleotide sugar dehydrogenase [Candidatus Sumerlaeia bacterium]
MKTLQDKIEAGKAVIGVVGLGYVGLPLAALFLQRGFHVIGFDNDPAKIDLLNAGKSYIGYIPDNTITDLMGTGRFQPTSDLARTRQCDAILICLPTPLTRNREPDVSYIVRNAEEMSPHLRAGQLIALESTTYPGTTREVLIPALESSTELRAGTDFHVAYSPEREDPNNKTHTTASIPKVVGAIDAPSLEAATKLYSAIVERVVPVSSTDAAEATKLVENIFRCVNIAMVNELKMVFQRMGIDIWEVIAAASTKPFGYMPFFPGPGLGGHCIPIDPFYLTWKAREYDMPTKFIELAGEINTHMPYFVVANIMDALNQEGKPLRASRILLVGLAYKPDVDDLRESPTLKLIDLLEERGAATAYHDPHIPEIKPTREYPHLEGRKSIPLDSAGEYDCVVIATNHGCIDYQALAQSARLIVDTRNAMAGQKTATPIRKA